jgi:tetratricopeptide (TPR) repeat protein
MVLSAMGRTTEGLNHLTEAVAMNPEDAGARATLGDALIEANRPAEALLHYQTALRLQPDHAPMLHTSIANALVRLGRMADAIRHYEDALRLNPNDAEARANLSAVRTAAQKRGLLQE